MENIYTNHQLLHTYTQYEVEYIYFSKDVMISNIISITSNCNTKIKIQNKAIFDVALYVLQFNL